MGQLSSTQSQSKKNETIKVFLERPCKFLHLSKTETPFYRKNSKMNQGTSSFNTFMKAKLIWNVQAAIPLTHENMHALTPLSIAPFSQIPPTLKGNL